MSPLMCLWHPTSKSAFKETGKNQAETRNVGQIDLHAKICRKGNRADKKCELDI